MSRHSNLNTSDHHQIFKEMFIFFIFSKNFWVCDNRIIYLHFLTIFSQIFCGGPNIENHWRDAQVHDLTWWIHDSHPLSQKGKTRKCYMQIAVFTHHWTTSIKQTEHNKEPVRPKLWEVWSPQMRWSIPGAAASKKAAWENIRICVYIYFRNTFTLCIVHVRKGLFSFSNWGL